MKGKKVMDGIAGVLHNGGLDAHRNYGFMGKSIGIWNDFRRGFAREIYNNRKEIGLFTLDDIEIDEDKIRKALRDMPFLTAIAKERRDECRYDIAKAIAKKKPIQVKK